MPPNADSSVCRVESKQAKELTYCYLLTRFYRYRNRKYALMLLGDATCGFTFTVVYLSNAIFSCYTCTSVPILHSLRWFHAHYLINQSLLHLHALLRVTAVATYRIAFKFDLKRRATIEMKRWWIERFYLFLFISTAVKALWDTFFANYIALKKYFLLTKWKFCVRNACHIGIDWQLRPE